MGALPRGLAAGPGPSGATPGPRAAVVPHLLDTHSQFRFRGHLRVFLALAFSSQSPGAARVPGVSGWLGIHRSAGACVSGSGPRQAGSPFPSPSQAATRPSGSWKHRGNGRAQLPCPRALALRDFQAGQLGGWSTRDRGRAGGRGRGSRSRGARGWRGGSRADPGPLRTGLPDAGGKRASSWGGAQGQGVGVPGHRSYRAHHAAGLTSGHWSHRNGVLLSGGWRRDRVVIPDGF